MMDWFHSSQFRQQILGENSSNTRKGYKVCSMTTDSDLDKSETPLLCEADKKKVPSVLPEKTKSPSHSENISTETSTSKKSPQGFANFHQASTSEKESNKTKVEPRSLRMSYKQEGKSQENEKLLIDFGNSDDKEEDDDDDM